MIVAAYDRRQHLARAELLAPQAACPICGHAGTRGRRLVIQHDPDVDLLRCPQCFGLSASRMPTREALDDFYRSYYSATEAQVVFQNPARLARHIAALGRFGATPSRVTRIIDFGGGDGTISRLTAKEIAARSGAPVRVEVIDFATAAPSHDGLVEVVGLRDLNDAQSDCDLVIASGVFEHVPEFGPVLKQLVGRMRGGGVLYARTLYGLPLMRLFGFDMSYPSHVHDLGDAFWGRLPAWFSPRLTLLRSRPAIVESDLKRQFLRTVLAHCCKLPARIECLWTRHPLIKLYGGWEALLRKETDVTPT